MGKRKFVQTVQVTWTRWPPCSYMVKTLKNLLLWNQKANDLESWYAALGTRVLLSMFWVDVDLFYSKVKFASLCFCMENGKTMDFSQTTAVNDIKIGKRNQLNKYMNLYAYQRSRSFIDLHRRSLRLNIFKLVSLETSRLIEINYYIEPPRDWGMEMNTNGLCHMTKLATMPIYGKNL